VLRILRHELRRLNTGNKLKFPTRSVEAQAVIDGCAAAGEKVRTTTATTLCTPTTSGR
jgi:hypothetical protein